jgi:hypothetical protein
VLVLPSNCESCHGRVLKILSRGRACPRGLAAPCGLPHPPPLPGTSTYTDGSQAGNLPPCVLHFTRPEVSEDAKPGAGPGSRQCASPAAMPLATPPPVGRERYRYRKDVGRAENLRPAFPIGMSDKKHERLAASVGRKAVAGPSREGVLGRVAW